MSVNHLRGQILSKFNIKVRELIINIRDLVVTDKDTDSVSNYNTFETVVNNILIPFKPEILINTFKKMITDNKKYVDYIVKRNDSLFSSDGIYEEYSNIYNVAIADNNTSDTQYIANLIAKHIDEHQKKKANKSNDPGTQTQGTNPDNSKLIYKINSSIIDKKGEVDLKKINCDKIMTENKKEITQAVEKYRTRWDKMDQEHKKKIWDTLNIMNYLAGKF